MSIAILMLQLLPETQSEEEVRAANERRDTKEKQTQTLKTPPIEEDPDYIPPKYTNFFCHIVKLHI